MHRDNSEVSTWVGLGYCFRQGVMDLLSVYIPHEYLDMQGISKMHN